MNRIDTTIHKARESGRKLLSPYLTAGDPAPALTVPLMHALVAAGADILELGIPFSDPMAEGPVIQAAMERALAQGMTSENVLAMVREFRTQDATTPIILMGYLNPIEQYGYQRFAADARDAGVDGTILVDLPPEESQDLASIWHEANLHPIYLCSPTTTHERMALINSHARGYLYYVSMKGVTGADGLDLGPVQAQYEAHKAQVDLPMFVGFGIKSHELAAGVASFADGVVVGAALVETVFDAHTEQNDAVMAASQFVQSLRQAMD